MCWRFSVGFTFAAFFCYILLLVHICLSALYRVVPPLRLTAHSLGCAALGEVDVTALTAIEVAFGVFIMIRDALVKAYPRLPSEAAGGPFIYVGLHLSEKEGLHRLSGRSIGFPALRKSFPPSSEHVHF
jgi:hypothetical protein